MRPRLFIGSSTERLSVAMALQSNLERHADVTVWTQGTFAPSEYPLESLERAAARSDAGIFVLVPDDFTTSRGETQSSVRDNVLFELGLFIGVVGRRRSYIVVPRDRQNLRLPSDLAGLTPLDYDASRPDRKWEAALGPASTRILAAINDAPRSGRDANLHVDRLAFFADFDAAFAEEIPRARRITTFFIHSRRWRETHDPHLKTFLAQSDAQLTIIMPEPGDAVLEGVFLRNFSDGPLVPSFVRDACRYFADLSSEFPGRVAVWFTRNYPTYSFYILDDTAIVAMYPTTARKKPVPTMRVHLESPFGKFLAADLEILLATARLVSAADLSQPGSSSTTITTQP